MIIDTHHTLILLSILFLFVFWLILLSVIIDGPSRNFWIIATDYNNYLAVYSCTEFPDDNSLPLRFYEQHSWVVDRKPDGVKHLPESVKRGFEELGISMEPFVFMDRNCD